MVVGADLCNTIANVNLELLKYFSINYLTYPFSEVPQGFFETSRGLEILLKAEPLPNAHAVLRNLNGQGHRIEYITNRPKSAYFVTRRWLELNGFPAGRIVFTENPEEKANYVISRGIQLFFEDDPRVISNLNKTGALEIFVKDWQYNRSLVRQQGLKSFKRWSEFLVS
ncbi:5' nucleotidase, deoxy (Pyrimidine), cytosolic type C protein (NT5C) [Pelotomaculum schinkii]|uniref:5' nucleotidase, deoxy (Pyrimidine), cytosolic type C protein (NT5C) n=1 Tax=Pelotomaculum schinkii TaxID=78350 RepID=A0A4Y7R7N9_9FIRM|nr:hypothetical protein [Pelotomaculum schinkii]TEB04739.1 5' nucleotidase, deoxy (Pyrimidine), cytosolic type C protein (NT5C) [Pelotomaculum schinkii]